MTLVAAVAVIVIGAAIAVWFTLRSQAADKHPAEISITTSTGTHRFTVEWAVTPEERSRGLMFREKMDADHGMIFDFLTEQPVSFWMRNTILPLDMVFIHADGTVYRVAEDTVPYSETPVPSGAPVRYVLELNAGTSRTISLDPGDRVDLD